MVQQRYVINNDLFDDFDVENVINCTKKYSKTKLSQYLKNKFGAAYLLVAEQVELFDKLKIKLPEWSVSGCLVTRRSLEQCSSQGLAAFKAGLLSGRTLVDLCGGLGVDDVAFSKRFEEVISMDTDAALNEIARFNFNRLLIRNITRIDGNAESYLENLTKSDRVFYVDADRRPDTTAKVVTLKDSSPDVTTLMPVLLEKGRCVMLKLSPMIDLSLLMGAFQNITDIYVVGIKNEVKEVLVVLSSSSGSEPVIHAVETDDSGSIVREFVKHNAITLPLNKEENTGYFYEPANMVIKAGLSSSYAMATGTSIVHKNSHYATGPTLVNNYFGRSFLVIHHSPFSKTAVKGYLKARNIVKANVSARNFVSPVDEIRKTFLLKDGGEEYLFFTQDAARNKLFWHCHKV